MISLADFQPLSVAKIKIFSYISNRDFTEGYFSDKVHAILIEEVPVQTTLSDDGATSVDSQVYYFIRTKIFTPAFIFCAKYSHIMLQCLSVKANL